MTHTHAKYIWVGFSISLLSLLLPSLPTHLIVGFMIKQFNEKPKCVFSLHDELGTFF